MERPEIDDDVPVPKMYRQKSPIREFLAELAVGQSFIIPAHWKRYNVTNAGKSLGFRLRIRTVVEHKRRHVRCWRVG